MYHEGALLFIRPITSFSEIHSPLPQVMNTPELIHYHAGALVFIRPITSFSEIEPLPPPPLAQVLNTPELIHIS